MAIFLNPDNANFNEAVHSKIYVDKTGLIEYTNSVLSTTAKFVCNSRPRRFGKSMTADMLCAYYSKGCDSRELFQPYMVSSCSTFEKYINQYDVIHIDVQWCKDQVENINDIVNYIKGSCMHELQNEYSNIDYNGIISLSGTLSKINDETGHRFVVIIDEWDVLIRDNANNKKLLEEYIDFLKGLFKESQPSRYIALAYLTGILPIKRTMTQSALNNFDEYTMLNPGPLASFIGFTEGEVKVLSNKYNIDFERIKKWYDGFVFGKITDIYNPWSILNFLDKGKIDTYWANTSSNGLVSKLVREGDADLKSVFEELLKGKNILCPIDEQIVYNQLDDDSEAVWSLLLASGYLKVVSIEKKVVGKRQLYELSLTNMEVLDMFYDMVRGWFKKSAGNYNAFVKALLINDVEAMNEYMNVISEEIFSNFDVGTKPSKLQPERFYHGFVLGLLVDLAEDYIVTSNRESGFGRYDVMIEPKDRSKEAFILEFKVYNPRKEDSLEETVENALIQIEEKQYETNLSAKGIPIDNIKKYGFAFKGKKVLIGCRG